jgi:hypothetical protein
MFLTASGSFYMSNVKSQPHRFLATAAASWWVASYPLLLNFRLNEHCQLRKRLLPAEIADFYGNRIWNAFLHDVEVGTAGNRLKRNGNLQKSRQVWVIKLVGIAKELIRNEFEVFTSKRMSFLRCEIGE